MRVTHFLFGLLLCATVHAQEQLGLALGTFAGTDALALNPARAASQRPWLDINILGLDQYVWNDRVSLRFRGTPWLKEAANGIKGLSDGTFDLVDIRSDRDHAAFVSTRIAGPAFSVSLGRSAIGAHLSTRAYTSVVGVSPALSNFIMNGLDHRPQHGIRYRDEHVRVTSAAWTEVGFSYAAILKAQGNIMITGGATARYLTAHHGASLVLETLDHTVVDSMRATIHEASGLFGSATPGLTAGQGWGMDIGFELHHMMEAVDRYLPHRSGNGCTTTEHDWRLGISLLDLGALKYSTATTGSFNTASAEFPDYDAITIDGPEGMDSLLSASLDRYAPGSALRIGMPTALSVQYDQRIARNLNVGAAWVQNVAPRAKHHLRRTNTLGVVPRYGDRWAEVALPIVVHEYRFERPGVGLMLRVHNITLGSDHIMPLLTGRDLRMLDVYLRVKWTIHRSPYCRGRKAGKRMPGDTGALPCELPF